MTTTPTLRDAAQALKPCPFCGGSTTAEPISKADGWFHVTVEHNACFFKPAKEVLLLNDEYLERWNRRAALANPVEFDGIGALAAPADALAEPVEWQHRMGPTDSWQECTKEFHDWVLRAPREWPGSEVRALVDAAAIRAKGQQ